MRIRQDGYQREIALLMYHMGVGRIQDEELLISSPSSCILPMPYHTQGILCGLEFQTCLAHKRVLFWYLLPQMQSNLNYFSDCQMSISHHFHKLNAQLIAKNVI